MEFRKYPYYGLHIHCSSFNLDNLDNPLLWIVYFTSLRTGMVVVDTLNRDHINMVYAKPGEWSIQWGEEHFNPIGKKKEIIKELERRRKLLQLIK